VTAPEVAGSRCGAGLVIAVHPPHARSRKMGGLHVGDDNGDVLESQVVAADIGRVWRTRLGECEELDRLFAKSEWDRAGLRALDAGQSRKRRAPWCSTSIASKPKACR
jgi:hypothetical protein